MRPEARGRSAPVAAAPRTGQTSCYRLYRVAGGWARAALPAPVLAAFALSRLAFAFAATVGWWLVPRAPRWSGRVTPHAPAWLALHWHWDAVYYYTIALGGYGASPAAVRTYSPADHLPAFFPLWPLLLRAAASLATWPQAPAAVPFAAAPAPVLAAGMVLTNLVALVALRNLHALVARETGDAARAGRAVLYAALAPAAFCYAIPYTEGLFLATSTAAFLAARQGRWLRAGLWAAAGAATRSVGILLLPALALEVALAWRRGTLHGATRWRAAGGLLLAPTGLLAFMLHLYRTVGDPLAWLHASQRFWHRDLVFPWVTVWRGLTLAFRPAGSASPVEYAVSLASTALVCGALFIVVTAWRRWPPAYTVYGALLLALLLATPLPGGRAMFGLARYLVICFPVYGALARWGARPAAHRAILAVSLAGFTGFAALYVAWYFVG
jgi:hypothetical protein